MSSTFSIRGAALSPLAKYRVLAALSALGAAQCVAFALWPPTSDTRSAFVVVGAVALTASALVAWLILPKLARWWIDVWVALLSLGVCAAAYYGASASDQLTAALALCLLASYCAYFLPLRRMVLQLAWMIALFVTVTVASPQLDSPLYVGIVVATLIALAWMVSVIAAQLAAAAIRDPLTGVLNRRGLVEAAELIHAVTIRADRKVTVVAIDLNDFKGYNDRHGHPAGDKLLVDVASSWQRVLRSSDVLARTGGDEFIIVLADTDAASAHALLARLHEANRARWSAGLVDWPQGKPFAEVLSQGDKALYLAKVRNPPQ